jgi:hypothetical protein
MTRTLAEDQARLARTIAQHLAEPAAGADAAVAQVVARLVGVQAQDVAAAALALRARCAGLTAADVEHARVATRSIVRTWCMRGTLHHVPSDDLGWLLGLLGPIFIRASRGRRAQLGLDESSGERAVVALCDVLGEHGPLTRDEIVEKLAGRGVALAGQARPHLLGLAALQGLVCHGPLRGRQPTYVLTADWIDPGPALPRDEALARLALRYLTAFAPAAPEDLATWSGLSLTEARAGWQQIADQLVEVQVGRAALWILKEQEEWLDAPPAPQPAVRLVPGFENYLLGYRNRSLILASDHAGRVFTGGGMLASVLLVDGRGAGTWKAERHRSSLDVIVEPFEPLDAAVQTGLAVEIDDVRRFLVSIGA